MDISNVLEEIRVKMKGDMIMAGNVSGLQAQRAGLVANLEAAQKSGDAAAIKEAKVALFNFDGANPTPAETTVEKSDDKPLTPEQQAKKDEAHQRALQEIAEAKALATAEATATTEAWTEDPVTQFVDKFGRTRDVRIAGQYTDDAPTAEVTASAAPPTGDIVQSYVDEFGRTRDIRIAGQYTDDAPTAGVTASVAPPTGDIVQSYTDEFGRTHDIRIAGQYDETPIPEPQPQDIAEHDSQDAATYSYAPQKGESLADIVQAKYPNTDIKKALSEIKAANPDLGNGMFKVGQKINLPTLADGTEPDLDAQVTPRGRR